MSNTIDYKDSFKITKLLSIIIDDSHNNMHNSDFFYQHNTYLQN